MIKGYFPARAGPKRPFVDGIFYFPTLGNRGLEVRLLVDTGADRTLLAPVDAKRLAAELGLDLATLPKGEPSTGIGGQMETRTMPALLAMDDFTTPLSLIILEPAPDPRLVLPIPSLLGRDILTHFALYLEERTGRVLLLEPEESALLNLT